MDQDPINSWLEKMAELSQHATENATSEVKVIQRKHKPVSQGSAIIELAEKLRPALTKMFQGVRDENEQLVQPARVRGIALNLAQAMVKEYQN